MQKIQFLSFFLLCLSITDGHAQEREIKVATINIRIDLKKDSLNPWSIRKKQIFDFVKAQDLDVICFQEVLWRQFNNLKEAMPEYSYVIRGRTTEKSEAIPVFYKTDKYDKLNSGTFWLSESPDRIGSIGWDAKNPCIVTWVKLKEKKTGVMFYVLNAHPDHIGKIAREKSMELIKDSIAKYTLDSPVILAGDMNSSTESKEYVIAKEIKVKMNDTYDIAKRREGVQYSFHGFGKRKYSKRKRIDFIYVSEQIKVKDIYIPEEKKVNGVYMSDHNPVVVTLEIEQ